MPETKRSTVYFEPKVYRALKIKAAVTDESISDLVNDAVRESLRGAPRGNTSSRARRLSREDAADLDAFRKRRHEKGRPFSEFLKELKRDGLL